MSALKRPTGQPMIKAHLGPAGPTDEPRVSSKVLDMTAPAVLPAVLVAVEPGALANAHRQVVVAAETCVGIDPSTRRMAFDALRVAFQVGMGAAELSGGKELRTRTPWHDCPEHRSREDHDTQTDRRCKAPTHSEKTHR
jgi:hypothetical protein